LAATDQIGICATAKTEALIYRNLNVCVVNDAIGVEITR
jgi:hypothetical protein